MFALATINTGGYIKLDHPSCMDMVHRESRGIHHWAPAGLTLDDVKPKMVRDEHIILELTTEGGGAAIWVQAGQIDEIKRRLNYWKGCYGAWPVKQLNGTSLWLRADDR